MAGYKRQINIELLRIIAMLLVLLGHYNPINGSVASELINCNILKAIGIAEIKSWTFLSVPSFIVISGYFGIHWKWKGISNYLFQIGFWGGMVYLLTWVLGIHDFSMLNFLQNSICFMHGVNWFFAAYLGLYMFSPILNAFIENAKGQKIMWMVLAFFSFQTVFGWIFKASEFLNGLTTTSLIGWYLLGGWIRKANIICFNLPAWKNLLIVVVIGQFCVFFNIVTQSYGIQKDIFSNISPLQVIQTTYLFLFCRSLTIRKGKHIIAFLASSAFAGLLIHSWQGADLYRIVLLWINEKLPAPFVFSLIFIILFFIAACCLDKIRVWCWKKVCGFVKC